ncbi:MAG: class I SAM-dependent methyltransferase [Armatimonadota bacterium]
MSQNDDFQHYFTTDPDVPSDPRILRVKLRGHRIELWTDTGVFSCERVDTGTKALIKAMRIEPDEDVLDWGAGYGVIGIVAALMEPTCRVTMVEMNQRAADLAERNIERNAVKNATVIAGEAPDVLQDRRFDRILCNAPVSRGRQVVLDMISDSRARLRPGGELWTVIHTRRGAKRYIRTLEETFAEAWTETITGGYRVLVGRKAETEEI